MDAISAPKRHDALPVVLSPEEVVRFLGAVMDQKHRVILTTCYAAGLRVSEALHLQVGDIDSRRMVLHVGHGTGNRDRDVMVSPTLLVQLRAWWRAARPARRLFPGQRPGQPMNKGAVQWACRLAGFRSRLTTRDAPFIAPRLRRPPARRIERRIRQLDDVPFGSARTRRSYTCENWPRMPGSQTDVGRSATRRSGRGGPETQ